MRKKNKRFSFSFFLKNTLFLSIIDAYHRQTLTPANRRSIVTHVIAARFVFVTNLFFKMFFLSNFVKYFNRYRKDVKYMVEDMHAQLAEQRPDIKTRMRFVIQLK